MNKKKKIYYVYFRKGRRNGGKFFLWKKDLIIEEEPKCGFNGISVIVNNAEDGSLSDRKLKKIETLLKDFDTSETVVVADSEIAKKLDISDVLFMAIKNEFIKNCDFIFSKIKESVKNYDTAVIVLGSSKWNVKDIYSILTSVKNHYEKIEIVTEYQIPGITNLVELAYDEWGLVLRVYSIRNYHGAKRALAVLLLDKWRRFWERKVIFDAAYLITDENMSVNAGDIIGDKKRRIFSGLKYKSDIEIDDMICTHMTWQKPVLCEKFHVSVIDICEL